MPAIIGLAMEPPFRGAMQEEFLSILPDRGIAAPSDERKAMTIDAACGQIRRRVASSFASDESTGVIGIS